MSQHQAGQQQHQPNLSHTRAREKKSMAKYFRNRYILSQFVCAPICWRACVGCTQKKKLREPTEIINRQINRFVARSIVPREKWHSFLNLPSDLSFAYCFMTTNRSWRKIENLICLRFTRMQCQWNVEWATWPLRPAEHSIGHDVDGFYMTHFERAFAFAIPKMQQRHHELNGMEMIWREEKKGDENRSHVSNDSESSLETVITADGRQCLLKRFITEIEKSKSRFFQWPTTECEKGWKNAPTIICVQVKSKYLDRNWD